MSTNYTHGHDAEEVATNYLKAQGFKILDVNWKTKLCEIDIVAQNNNVAYLVEVKYRKTADQGHGLDYITPKKLKQMQFAAELWVRNNSWQDQYQLAVIEVTGDDYTVTEFVLDI